MISCPCSSVGKPSVFCPKDSEFRPWCVKFLVARILQPMFQKEKASSKMEKKCLRHLALTFVTFLVARTPPTHVSKRKGTKFRIRNVYTIQT